MTTVVGPYKLGQCQYNMTGLVRSLCVAASNNVRRQSWDLSKKQRCCWRWVLENHD